MEAALEQYSRIEAPSLLVREKNGVVYTRKWVVDLILDLVGYTSDRPLADRLLVEPSAGDGSFLIEAVSRLIESCHHFQIPIQKASQSLAAYELNPSSAAAARASVSALLESHGLSEADAASLAQGWIVTGDYLLSSRNLRGMADYVVGNPPYIRLEDLAEKGAVYRSAFPTMVGRADIYVAFYEAALRQLKKGGVCGFICADRWMFNQYGSELRRLVTSQFSVDAVIQMHHADAFESEVSAYPAVTVISRTNQGPVMVASFDPETVQASSAALAVAMADKEGSEELQAVRVEKWFSGSDPWPLMSPGRLALLRRLEAEFFPIEATGAVVGIGVATGADKIFITKDKDLVEEDRLLPLAMAADAKSAQVAWSGHFLVNPWNGSGLVDLSRYPKLKAYLEEHREHLSRRHVGLKSPANWYRTIDKVASDLRRSPKLYLPDFKGRIAPTLDRGETYPHHNLYFIHPGHWDPEVLGGLLLSDVAQFFIEAYGVKMRGGYLRFQAQYLRRLCVPHPSDLSSDQEQLLRTAFQRHDASLANDVTESLYRLTPEERRFL